MTTGVENVCLIDHAEHCRAAASKRAHKVTIGYAPITPARQRLTCLMNEWEGGIRYRNEWFYESRFSRHNLTKQKMSMPRYIANSTPRSKKVQRLQAGLVTMDMQHLVLELAQ